MAFKNIKGNVKNSLLDYFVSGKAVQYYSSEYGLAAKEYSATGGTILEPGNGYKYHFFTTSSTPGFEFGGIPTTIDYIVIGGGGGGGGTGWAASGGGGAGGFRAGSSTITEGSYPIVIGDGGAGGDSNSNGSYSEFFGIRSEGGGKGGYTIEGTPGGSGGGGSQYGAPGDGGLGNRVAGTTTPVPQQGYPGGEGNPSISPGTYGGGGGGGGGAGFNFNSSGNGGVGLSAFSGDSGIPPSYGTPGPTPGRWFAGGGGAGRFVTSGAGGLGGAGGGGNGGDPGSLTSGANNTGSGGGGGSYPYVSTQTTNKGGSGIVIIRYLW